MTHNTDIIILGAGASGLMCAMTAATRGHRVTLVDHGGKPGRKILVAGGGKCNFTNTEVGPDDYVGRNADFCRSALARFSPWEMVALLEEHGVPWEERDHGQLFCRRSAADVVEVLTSRCRDLGCRFEMGRMVTGARQDADGYIIDCEGTRLAASRLVVATGSPAWPQVGASDIGHRIARSFGHRIEPVRPVLVPLVMPEGWQLGGLQGISLEAGISTGGVTFVRDLLFTHRGVSGPAALLASCHWLPGMPLRFDFLPGVDIPALCESPDHRRQLVRTMLTRLLPERLATRLIPDDLGGRKAAELSRADRQRLADAVRSHTVVPTGTEGMRKAEAAAGGVDTGEVSSRTMESLKMPGLFFSGEVLDVAGHLGGYNLHWAWASGRAAGEAI